MKQRFDNTDWHWRWVRHRFDLARTWRSLSYEIGGKMRGASSMTTTDRSRVYKSVSSISSLVQGHLKDYEFIQNI